MQEEENDLVSSHPLMSQCIAAWCADNYEDGHTATQLLNPPENEIEQRNERISLRSLSP